MRRISNGQGEERLTYCLHVSQRRLAISPKNLFRGPFNLLLHAPHTSKGSHWIHPQRPLCALCAILRLLVRTGQLLARTLRRTHNLSLSHTHAHALLPCLKSGHRLCLCTACNGSRAGTAALCIVVGARIVLPLYVLRLNTSRWARRSETTKTRLPE